MVDFGIGGEWGAIIRYAELFLVSGLTLTLTLLLVTHLYSRLVSKKPKISTTANHVSGSMRNLQPDENKYFIKPSMKPHYHGAVKIGYVEAMKFGCHIFDAKGELKGIVGNEQRGREFLRGVHKITMEWQVAGNGRSRESFDTSFIRMLGSSSHSRPGNRH